MTHFHCGCTIILNKGCDFCICTQYIHFILACAIVLVIFWQNIGTAAIQCNRTYSFLNKTGTAPTLGLLSMKLQRQSGVHNLIDYCY